MKKITLHQAISEALENDGKIDRFEALVLRELVLADNQVSARERAIIEEAIAENSVDDDALVILSNLLSRFTSRR